MGATFGRLKVWVKERLKYSDLNAEFNNILNNLTPSGVDDYSTNNAEMRSTADPAPYNSSNVQVESLATSTAGELQRLRYVLRRFFGSTYWYTDPGRCLAALPSDLACALSFDGNTANEVYSDFIERGGIINALSLSSADVLASDFDGTNKKFGNYSYILGAGNILAFPGKLQSAGAISAHFRNLSANDYIAYNPLLGIELYLNASGFLVAKIRKATSAVEGVKDTSTVTGSTSRAGSSSWQHACLRYVLGASGQLSLKLDGSDENTEIAASILGNSGQGGVWFFGAKKNDPSWDKFSAMKDLPKDESSSPWTDGVTGSASAAVSNGVLSLVSAIGGDAFYSKTNNINMASMTIETKAKVVTGSNNYLFDVYDHSMSRRLYAVISSTRISFLNGPVIYLNGSEYQHVRVTLSGSPSPTVNVYINGQLVNSFTLSTVNSLTSDYIKFGSELGDAMDVEYIAYHGSGGSVYPPVAVDTSGNLDDIAMVKSYISTDVVTQLRYNAAKNVFGADPKLGLTLPSVDTTLGTSGTVVRLYLPSDGKTVIEAKFDSLVTAAIGGIVGMYESTSNLLDVYEMVNANQGRSLFYRGTLKLGLRSIEVQGSTIVSPVTFASPSLKVSQDRG